MSDVSTEDNEEYILPNWITGEKAQVFLEIFKRKAKLCFFLVQALSSKGPSTNSSSVCKFDLHIKIKKKEKKILICKCSYVWQSL